MSKNIFTNEQKELYSLMLPIHGAILTQSNTAKLLNVSNITLYRMRENGIGPGYKKGMSKSKNGCVVYPLQEIVKYLTTENIKLA